MITNSQTVYVGPSIQWLSLPMSGLGISISFVIALLLVVFTQLLLTRTVFGRYIIAIGTNETAAKISGIRTEPYLASVLVISGMFAGIGGLMSASYLGASDPNAAIGLEPQSLPPRSLRVQASWEERLHYRRVYQGYDNFSFAKRISATRSLRTFQTADHGFGTILAVLIDRWRHRL